VPVRVLRTLRRGGAAGCCPGSTTAMPGPELLRRRRRCCLCKAPGLGLGRGRVAARAVIARGLRDWVRAEAASGPSERGVRVSQGG
jgi:hypothetical protein